MALTEEDEKEIDEQAKQMVSDSKTEVIALFILFGVVMGFIFGTRGWWFLGGGIIAMTMFSKLTIRLRN